MVWRTIGQQKAISLLESSLRTNTLSHAYLIIGLEHIGKTTLAYDLAMAINCPESSLPCCNCPTCHKILHNNHPDIMQISLEMSDNNPEKKNRIEIGIDEIKRLQQFAYLPPYEGKYKVIIINGADKLSSEAANCLLKTLEEPLPHIVLILLATDYSKLLPTITSRCQLIQLKPVSTKSMEEILIKRYNSHESNAKLISRLSGGCPGYAITALDEGKLPDERKQIISELILLFQSNLDYRFSYASQFEGNRKKAEKTLYIWLIWCRDIILSKYNCNDNIINIDFNSELDNWAQLLNINEIKNFIDILHKYLLLLTKNVNIRLLMENLMFNLPVKQANN
jgi:DNA polymerase-3 subunit delta'